MYAAGHARLTLAGARVAALLASGDGAVLSHRTAADLWALRSSNPRIVDVTIYSRAGRTPRPGIRLHRAPLPRNEVTRKDGFPVTSPARTLFDLSAVLTPRSLERAVDEAERLGLFDLGEMETVMAANRGRSGRPKLATVLAGHRAGSTLTRSELEERFLALCRANSLPSPEVNTRMGTFLVDFLWREQRLIVETDGRESHGTTVAFERDRARDARLTAAGYRVVRFTYRQIAREATSVARLLRALLGA